MARSACNIARYEKAESLRSGQLSLLKAVRLTTQPGTNAHVLRDKVGLFLGSVLGGGWRGSSVLKSQERCCCSVLPPLRPPGDPTRAAPQLAQANRRTVDFGWSATSAA